MKVLVVDDNKINRKIPMIMLGKMGIIVAEAESGAQALDAVHADAEISHLLLDVNMPGMSGNEVCSALRSEARGAQLLIIAYTAHAFPEERERIMAAGFDDLLTKPFKQDALVKALKIA